MDVDENTSFNSMKCGNIMKCKFQQVFVDKCLKYKIQIIKEISYRLKKSKLKL